MTSESFVHLHNHTEYSMLDGAARIDDLFADASRMGMPAIAITDHGFLFGAYEFWKKSAQYGVKPIIGLEAYLTPGTSRFDRSRVRWGNNSRDDVSGGGAYTHFTLLAETTSGMNNLFRMASLASLEGYFYKPRMDRDLLHQYSDGLIATTGCVSGEVQTRLRLGQYAEAIEAAAELRDIFGPNNYFCEIMDHGLDIERRTQKDLLQLAKDLNLPLVATNDLHYVRQKDANAHAALLCVQSGSTLADPKRFKFDGTSFYLKSPREMRQLWREIPDACDNTLVIAERCNASFSESSNLMPHFPVPDGESEHSWFVAEVECSLRKRYPNEVPADVRNRINHEVSIICQMGFPGYFLVVADLINWARTNGIRVGPGRGSVVGSLVAFILGITEINPLSHDLIFERFLNPERLSMPDIDIDIDEYRRGEVIKHIIEHYGEKYVAQIATFGTIKAKQSIKDASRVLGYPFLMGEKLTKAMPPPVMGKDIPISGIFDPDHPRYDEAGEFRNLHDSDEEIRKVVACARGLEGLKRQWGVHAAGIIMSSEPLIDHIPIMQRDRDGAIITQFDYPTCETLGLLKMDFLGLRNLTIIDDTLKNIVANGKSEPSLDSVKLNDPKVYELLTHGDTLGIFQLDSDPIRSLLRQMQPDRFEDITAVLALYRPGPMGTGSHINYALRKNGQQEITPIHPELAEPLAEILGTTYGLIVYQEQVIAIAQKVAGYTPGKADLLRRAMGKKKREILDKEFKDFYAGMKANGYSNETVKTLWEILLPFSDYAFNRAHAAGYGLISYWTAYLKANYPVEYMAALLTSVHDDKDRSALYLNECRRMGIKVLLPDINFSAASFTPNGDDIRFGFSAIRNIGTNVVNAIIDTRDTENPYISFEDFLHKTPTAVHNKRVIESLIKGGAFDSLGYSRQNLTKVYESIIDAIAAERRAGGKGWRSLFDELDSDLIPTPPVADVTSTDEWDKQYLLAQERDMLGLYVSGHPLVGMENALSRFSECSIGSIVDPDGRPDGCAITIAGLVTSLQRKITKQGRQWATATVEDLSGAIEVLFFPMAYEIASDILDKDVILSVKGRISRRDAIPVIYADECKILDLRQHVEKPFSVSLRTKQCTPRTVERLKEILRAHPGETDIYLRIIGSKRVTTMRLDNDLRIHPSPEFFSDLKALLGLNCLA